MWRCQNCFQHIISETSYSGIEPLSDGVLRTEDGATFNIHRILLVQRSDYFRALFLSQGSTKSDALIPGIGHSTLGQILRYIYMGRVQLEEGNLRDILVAADYLLLDCLLQEGRRFAAEEMNVCNCLPLFLAACEIERLELREETRRFVQIHFEQVVRQCGDVIGDLPLSSLEEFLGDKNLIVSGEQTVWLAILLWVKRSVVERLIFVPELILCLALKDIDEKLATEIVEHDFIQNNPYCRNSNIRKKASESSLDYLKHFSEHHEQSKLVLKGTRLPNNIFFIINYCLSNFVEGINLYLSYDEKIDFWYKVGELQISPDIVTNIGKVIYMLDSLSNKCLAFDLVNKECTVMVEMNVLRMQYCVVRLEDYIYTLGGYSQWTGEETRCVEFYDHNAEIWVQVSNMRAMESFCAAAIDGRIYAVGTKQGIEAMMTQVYDPVSDVWTPLSSPSVFRRNFALVVFRGRLYIIGGEDGLGYLKNVEMYDSIEDTWKSHTNMPFSYYLPKAVAIKDLLLVYDNHLEDRRYYDTNPPIYWNIDAQLWEILPASSPWNNIHVYQFCLFEDLEVIRMLVNSRSAEDVIPERSQFPLASIKFMMNP